MPAPWILWDIHILINAYNSRFHEPCSALPPCRVFGGFIGFRFELLYFYSDPWEVESKFMWICTHLHIYIYMYIISIYLLYRNMSCINIYIYIYLDTHILYTWTPPKKAARVFRSLGLSFRSLQSSWRPSHLWNMTCAIGSRLPKHRCRYEGWTALGSWCPSTTPDGVEPVRGEQVQRGRVLWDVF